MVQAYLFGADPLPGSPLRPFLGTDGPVPAVDSLPMDAGFRKILKGSALLTTSAAVSTAVRAAVALALVRYLGAADYGALAAAVALATMGCYAVDLGTATHVVREGSRNPDEIGSPLGDALGVTFSTLVVVALALVGMVHILDYPVGARLLMPALGMGILLQASRGPIHSALRALRRFGRVAWAEVVAAGLFALFCFYGVASGRTLAYFGWAHLFTGLGAISVSALLVRSLTRPRWEPDRWPSAVKASVPFFASNIFYVIYFQLDTVMLAVLRPAAEVGIYAAPYKVVMLLGLIPAAVSHALLPSAFALGTQDRPGIHRLFRLQVRTLGIIAVPISVALVLFAPGIVPRVLGPGYEGSAIILQILAVQVLLRCLAHAGGDALYALGRENRRTAIQGLAAASNLVLNVALIPRWGAAGAAVATVITEAIVAVLMLASARKGWGGGSVAAN